jgi:hypothetical protein
MGNRATVIFTDGKKEIGSAVYLHWNGGAESIYAFLNEMERRHIRADQEYETARFIHIVGEFFDQENLTGLSLGVVNGPKAINEKELAKVRTDHSDNGFYIINRTGDKPVMRRFVQHYEHTDGEYKEPTLEEMTEQQVEDERRKAEKSDSIKNIAEYYLTATKGKKVGN